jgi:hypothetical protein
LRSQHGLALSLVATMLNRTLTARNMHKELTPAAVQGAFAA